MVYEGASITQATLLRPAAQEMQAEIGGTIVLNLPDLGIEGPARILDLDSVTVERGPGRLVTAVFHHSSGKVYDLQVEGESNTIEKHNKTGTVVYKTAGETSINLASFILTNGCTRERAACEK